MSAAGQTLQQIRPSMQRALLDTDRMEVRWNLPLAISLRGHKRASDNRRGVSAAIFCVRRMIPMDRKRPVDPHIGQRLKEYRQHRGMTVRELAGANQPL
jgi:hypothetical protein